MIKTRLNQRQIEAFHAMMQTGSVSDAAGRINITQPAVSRLLKDLQHQLKLELFERVGNRLQPTPAAYSLLVEVERSFVGLERIATVAAELRRQRTSNLRISGMPALTNGFLTRVTGDFVMKHPELHVSLSGMLTSMVMEAVMNNQCDVGFIEGDTPTYSLRTIDMPPASRVAIYPLGHRFEKLSTVHIHDFEGEDFVFLKRNFLAISPVASLFIDHGISVQSRAESPLSEIVCGLVASGLGVSIVDSMTAAQYKGKGIDVRPIVPYLPFTFKAVIPTNESPLRLVLEYIDYVAEAVRRDWA